MGKSASEASRTYQGVRVKDPVKELLRRKRVKASTSTTGMSSNTHVYASSYTHAASLGSGAAAPSGCEDSVQDAERYCPEWVTQSTSPSFLQPLGHWPPESPQDSTASAYGDVFVQPICPSYTVVSPSSMLTLTHTPLFSNLGTVSSSSSALPQVDLQDMTYVPWAQSFSTIAVQQPAALSAPAVFSLPLSSPPLLQQGESRQTHEGTLALEKLLEDADCRKAVYNP